VRLSPTDHPTPSVSSNKERARVVAASLFLSFKSRSETVFFA
jgi:hypothetical protein